MRITDNLKSYSKAGNTFVVAAGKRKSDDRLAIATWAARAIARYVPFCAILALLLPQRMLLAGPQPSQSCREGFVSCADTNGPTFRVTTTWILTTLMNVAGTSAASGAISYSGFAISGCHLRYHILNVFRGNRLDDDDVDVPLEKTFIVTNGPTQDPDAPGWLVGFKTTTEAISVSGYFGEHFRSFHTTHTGNDGIYVGTMVDAQDYGERLQAALVHAAAICRAQATAERSSQPF